MIPLGVTQQASGTGSDSTLLTNLVSWWAFEEVSGTRVDSHGSDDLSDANTVTQIAGKVGDAAQFTAANTEYLGSPGTGYLSYGGDRDWTIAVWVYPDALAQATIINYGSGTTAAETDYAILIAAGTGQISFSLGVSTAFKTLATTFSSPLVVDTWQFVIFDHKASTKTISASINN